MVLLFIYGYGVFIYYLIKIHFTILTGNAMLKNLCWVNEILM